MSKESDELGDKLMADIQSWWEDYDWDGKWIEYMEGQ